MRRALKMAKVIGCSLLLFVRAFFFVSWLKLHLFLIRKKNSSMFKKSIKDLPPELQSRLAREYDNRLRKALSLRVTGFVKWARGS